jgi:hypothetical protein
MEDPRYKDVRERFFRGELHASTTTVPRNQQRNNNNSKQFLLANNNNPSATDLFERIDGRLRRVVVKACENSAPACKVVESFERFLVHSFHDNDGDDVDSAGGTISEDDFWHGILLEKPSVVDQQQQGRKAVTFLFDGDSSSGGFHRLLVHAVCHFHCLQAKTSSLEEGRDVKARVLLVHGIVRGSQYRLLDHLMDLEQQRA